MTPDWPNLPSYHTFTPADHAAHRSPKGIARPADLISDYDVRKNKMGKQLVKVARKPHLTNVKRKPVASRRKKRKDQ